MLALRTYRWPNQIQVSAEHKLNPASHRRVRKADTAGSDAPESTLTP